MVKKEAPSIEQGPRIITNALQRLREGLPNFQYLMVLFFFGKLNFMQTNFDIITLCGVTNFGWEAHTLIAFATYSGKCQSVPTRATYNRLRPDEKNRNLC